MTISEDVWRHEAPHVLAALLRRHRSFDDCEDAVQEALLAAAAQWPADGAPQSPRAWLIRVASRKIIDHRRSVDAEAARIDRYALQERLDDPVVGDPIGDDDTLRMLLLCAHPQLSDTSRVALTLRAVAGLPTHRIADLLLMPSATIGQRISRAKTTIREAGLTASTDRDLPERLNAVRHVLHLTFTAGHTTTDGSDIVDNTLVQEAIWMTERLHRALPDDQETTGLLALMLLTAARAAGRVDSDGRLIPLADQDRSLWDRVALERGTHLVEDALARGHTEPFQLQAAIAAVHAEATTAADTDWLQITMLYRMLHRLTPSPTVALNLAAAIGMAHGPQAGLDALGPLLADPAQRGNHRVHATRAHLLELAGEDEPARAAFALAASLTHSIPEQRYLNAKAARVSR